MTTNMDEDAWWKDTFAPIIELWRWIVGIIPTDFDFRRPHFNFITVHYLYMIGTTILWSIMLYPAGGMAYIDALFFAAGVSTQSGLNTIDINQLCTYQQVVFMLGCCFCTPVLINTVVVFVRLYWFERRFEHIVEEIRAQRRSRTLSFTKSRSKSRARDDTLEDSSRQEMGVGVRGKPIQILKKAVMRNPVAKSDSEGEDEKRKLEPPFEQKKDIDTEVNGNQSSTSDDTSERGLDKPAQVLDEKPQTPQTPNTPYLGLNPRLNRGITFADEVVNEDNRTPELARIPEIHKQDEDQDQDQDQDLSRHIRFLERQQANRNADGAYYIPGPREMDEGKGPRQLDRDQTMKRLHSRGSVMSHDDDRRSRSVDARSERSPHGHRVARGITIEEPDHPGHHHDHDDEISPVARRDRSRARSHQKSSRVPHLGHETSRSLARTLSRGTKNEDPMPYLSWTATTGRNSAFLGLSAEQRDELGGIEYRALKTLAGILICYYFGLHILGIIVLLPWIVCTQPWNGVVVSDGQNPVWWGIFTPASMFNDLGFTLTPDSMQSFQEATLPLLFGSFLIIVGNTGFPILLRFLVWLISRIEMIRKGPESDLYLELRFLLDHPRRCFTLLFPSKATWWLFWVLVLLNGIDLIFFIILDLNNTPVSQLGDGYKVLNGWFQAVSTRTAGFASVNLADLHAAIQVSYLIMMYISVFPIAISVRRTNVYEEKSLGLFGGEEDSPDGEPSYVSQHLRRQLSFDLWFIFLGLFIIAIVEGDRISNTNQPAFTTFSVLFEIVSAYGTVGLSLGYPGINASFSAEFRVISKLVIIAMMIRGRHRGLPYALDRAILLPSEKLQQKEAEESERQLDVQRRGSVFTQAGTWERGELDQSGLPRMHTATGAYDPMAAANESDLDGLRRLSTRRSTVLSTQSTGEDRSQKHSRSRSLSRFIAGALSAGPTMSKRD